MANPRVHEIATELGINSQVVLKTLQEMGEHVKASSSAIAPPVARKLKARIRDGVYQSVTTHFPALDAGQVSDLSDLFKDLPKSTRALLQLLVSGAGHSDPASSLLREVTQAGEVFCVQRTDAGSLDQAIDNATPLEPRHLLAATGVLIVEDKDPSRYRSYALTAWNFVSEEERLELASIRVALSAKTDRYGRSRVETTAPYYAERSASKGVFTLGQRKEVRALSALYSVVPIRARSDRENLQQAKGDETKPTTREGADYVRLYREESSNRERTTDTRPGVGKSAHHVRGHFRKQPYPSTGEVKEIWIKPYRTGAQEDVAPQPKPYLVKPITRSSPKERA